MQGTGKLQTQGLRLTARHPPGLASSITSTSTSSTSINSNQAAGTVVGHHGEEEAATAVEEEAATAVEEEATETGLEIDLVGEEETGEMGEEEAEEVTGEIMVATKCLVIGVVITGAAGPPVTGATAMRMA